MPNTTINKSSLKKGSWKRPLIYFGSFLALLIVIVSYSTSVNNSKNVKNLENVAFAGITVKQEGFQEPFIDSVNRVLPESPEIILVKENSLKASLPPVIITPKVLGMWMGEGATEDKREVTEYIVAEGDTLSSIAAKFNISANTILWANNLSQKPALKLGQVLIIPPVSGIIHHVKDGDTISSIALKYKAKAEDIIAFNDLSNEADIFIGDILIIPNGVMPAAPVKSVPVYAPIAKNYFICPISQPCRTTQRLHWYNAVDFSHGKCGDLIVAAAGGKVLKVKLTNSTSPSALGGGGNTITIQHPNGVVTTYGHLATSLVNPGDDVSQGQIIALMGGQPGTPGAGKSTGCHVHFQVIGASNPFAK